jgi:hypothetical protein
LLFKINFFIFSDKLNSPQNSTGKGGVQICDACTPGREPRRSCMSGVSLYSAELSSSGPGCPSPAVLVLLNLLVQLHVLLDIDLDLHLQLPPGARASSVGRSQAPSIPDVRHARPRSCAGAVPAPAAGCGRADPLQAAVHRQRDEPWYELHPARLRQQRSSPVLAEYGIYAGECTADQNAALDALVRADYSRGSRGPTGPLRTTSRTPWILAKDIGRVPQETLLH